MSRTREKNVVDLQSGSLWESLTLTTLGSDRKIFEDILDDARTLSLKKEEGKTIVYASSGFEWRQFGFPRARRPLPSVVLDRGISDELVKDVQTFLSRSEWYTSRGIPYRRGYLLHGPPGCGKSSFIFALAGELKLNICVLNLSAKGITDEVLNHLLINAPQRSIILLEDIDSTLAHVHAGNSVTFSGLLNALDGVTATEGRVTFMTTNRPSSLDSALTRPGRVDVIKRVGLASKSQAETMFYRFYPGQQELAKQFVDKFPVETISMAELQQYFMTNMHDPKDALANMDQLKSQKTVL
eukprot:TRINITY_DN12231_c0_g1_i2.p1 TRINITY_DN12231_c0_g1~~TRINITY_DN12231_c0_g1_i2.p1  ORF type:complete len:298 (+),score=57.24 TRINITY_DN12231_c0_g1_i2:477-1370(+)